MEQQNDYEYLANKLVEDYYKKQNARLLTNLSKKKLEELSVSKDKIKETIREDLRNYVDPKGNEITEEQKDIVLELVRRQLWGYGVVD